MRSLAGARPDTNTQHGHRCPRLTSESTQFASREGGWGAKGQYSISARRTGGTRDSGEGGVGRRHRRRGGEGNQRKGIPTAQLTRDSGSISMNRRPPIPAPDRLVRSLGPAARSRDRGGLRVQRTNCRVGIGTEARNWDESIRFPSSQPPTPGPRRRRARASWCALHRALQ